MKPRLTSRQHKILWATVRSYIATAEPVGSKTLAEAYGLGVSTATIRNDLAMLEQNGFLFQPHTSAGRVPSDSGYRVYVDDLLANQRLDSDDAKLQQTLAQLSRWLTDHADDSLDRLLWRAARILANLSGCIALVTAPQLQNAAIRHIHLAAIAPQRLMAIVVTDPYQTHSVLVNLADGSEEARDGSVRLAAIAPPAEELQLLSNFLTMALRGKTFAQLQDLSWLRLNQEFHSYTAWLQQLVRILAQRCLQPSLGQIFSVGVTELMRQPEFTQTQQVQAVVQLLEEDQSALGQVLSQNSPGQLTVYIGSENPLEPIRHCTLIVSGYRRGGDPLGAISLLGPTRMPYGQALVAVRAMSDHLSEALAQQF